VADELKIKVNGVEYPFPTFDTITYGEARMIKKQTDGLVLGQFYDALEKGDPDAMQAIAVLALKRHGMSITPEELDRLPLDAIEIVVPEAKEEHESGSPLDEKQPESPSVNGGETNSNVTALSGS
jgi:hypothetical protein